MLEGLGRAKDDFDAVFGRLFSLLGELVDLLDAAADAAKPAQAQAFLREGERLAGLYASTQTELFGVVGRIGQEADAVAQELKKLHARATARAQGARSSLPN